MLKTAALNLIQQYIDGWKQNNLHLITSCLKQDCIVIESHGPTYRDISQVEHWFKLWLKAGSRVLKWDMLSFYFCETESTAFVEWDFSCISNGVEYSFPGSSIIKFSEQKISFIHEY